MSTLASAQPGQLLPPDLSSPLVPAQHPKAEVINRVVANAGRAPAMEATGLTRDDYLRFITGQVRAFARMQDAQGRIIDPIEKKEVQYATPCYAHAVAVLARSGLSDAQLIESGQRAMDRAVWAMVNNQAQDHHGDFYTWPVMLALSEFEGVAAPDRLAGWRRDLARIDPSRLYNFYNNRQSLNWVLVHTAGEFLRQRQGMTGGDYVERMLEKQDHHFTPEGMYAEGGQPTAYDLFSRLFVTGMLAHGYSGAHAAVMRERMWRGAWMTMLMQSPTGEAPTGHRSSQHIWLEAEQCAILEAFASAAARANRADEAAMFKRAARLSLRTLLAWVRPDGTGYVVKNKFPPQARHGYESYSSLTQYNLLACSMAAQAYRSADDAIIEKSSPADVGGYVLSDIGPFHKIFANAGGGYVEYDTRGDSDDRNWVPCGLVRIHLRGAHPLLGPSDGVGVYANKNSPEDPSYAVGPAWQDANGKWTRLASLRPTAEPTVETLEQTPARVSFRVTHTLEGGVVVVQQITVQADRVLVEDRVAGARAMRAHFPMLINDGADETTVEINGNAVRLKRQEGGAVTFRVEGAAALTRTTLKLNARNGIVEPIYGEVSGETVRYEIAAR